MGKEKFDVVEFLQDELKSKDQATRLDCLKKIKFIMFALDDKPTTLQQVIVPFLHDLAKQDMYINDDEFLYLLGKAYIELIPYATQPDVFLVPMEWLACQEETVVRDVGVEGLGKICARPEINVSEQVLPILNRLAGADWFTARLSVCPLFPHVYPSVSEQQKAELRKLYGVLCSDETPMVRRNSALNLAPLVALVERQVCISDMIPIYRQLAQDDTQDIVRVSVIATSLVLIENVFTDSVENSKNYCLTLLTAACDDRSWRVRLAVATDYHRIVKAFGKEITAAYLMTPYIQLLKDNEQEVRAEAVCTIGKLLDPQHGLTTDQLLNFVIPQFQPLTLDGSVIVRAALAKSIAQVAVVVGREATQKYLLALIADLMKDESHEVRVNIVKNAAKVCSVIGIDVLAHSLLLTIQNLIMDPQWRIRKLVIEQVPALAQQFGPEMFQTKLEALFISSLADSVYAVRQAAILAIADIATNFGFQWVETQFWPKVIEQYSVNSGFGGRLTILQCLPQFAVVMPQDYIISLIIPTLFRAAKDVVPNVRLIACEILEFFVKNHKLPKVYVAGTLQPSLTSLLNDTDGDVQFQAEKTLRSVQETLAEDGKK